MSQQENTSKIPNPPKAIGLSRRLVIALVSVILCVMILFLVFLKRYAIQPVIHKLSYATASMSQENAVAQIEKIVKEGHHPVLVDENAKHTPTANLNNATPQSELGLRNSNAFREGSNARISVYHASTSNMLLTSSPVANRVSDGTTSLLNPLAAIKPPTMHAFNLILNSNKSM